MARRRLRACDIWSTWSSAPRDFSNLSALRSISFHLLPGTDHGQRDRRRRCVEGLALLDVGIPPLQFLSRLPLVGAQFGDPRDHAIVDAVSIAASFSKGRSRCQRN
jgi:hypothetical protein